MAPNGGVEASGKKSKTTAASNSHVKKPAAKTATMRSVVKKSTLGAVQAAKTVTDKKSKSKSKAKAVPGASMPASKKRKAESEPVAASGKLKKQKTKEGQLNRAPLQKLDILVFGSGESGELGLGHVTRNGKKPTDVKRPRLNDLLDASTVGVVQIAVGGMHCVALTHDGKVLTWGVNDNSALGRDTSWEAPTKDIDVSDSDEDSDDDDDEGDLGLNPKESTPTPISAECFDKKDGVPVQVAATDSASFVLTSKGLVYGWGTFSGSDGPIGFSSTVHKSTDPSIQARPTLIPHLTNIALLASGGNHMLALDARTGTIYAWGNGAQSQLGRPIMDRYRVAALTPSRVRLPRIRNNNHTANSKTKDQITAIAAGQHHSFALSASGKVYAWGLNNFAQTGILPPPSSRRPPSSSSSAPRDADTEPEENPTALIVATPTLVQSLGAYSATDPITALAGGTHHSLALTASGSVLSFGRCDSSQAGVPLSSVPGEHLVYDSRGRARILAVPTVVAGLRDVVGVAAGIDDCMAVTGEGKAYAWGFGDSYRTGLGSEEEAEMPVLVENSAMKGRKVVWAGCGGLFGVLAAVAGQLREEKRETEEREEHDEVEEKEEEEDEDEEEEEEKEEKEMVEERGRTRRRRGS